jgi:hypothetical protein
VTLGPKVLAQGGAKRVFYNSGTNREIGDLQYTSLQFSWGTGSSSLTPTFNHLLSYGGELWDVGLALIQDLSISSRLRVDYDLAYMIKIDGVSGWVQHLRTGYETRAWRNVQALFNLEFERNQYFDFDIRAMTYVANSL